VRGLPPGKETDGAILRYKGYAYPGVEAAEVGGHLRKGEVGTIDIFSRTTVFDLRRSRIIVDVLGKDRRQKPT
jgi:hypothetical protein